MRTSITAGALTSTITSTRSTANTSSEGVGPARLAILGGRAGLPLAAGWLAPSLAALAVGALVLVAAPGCAAGPTATTPTDGAMKLPPTSASTTMTLDEALASRRSVRGFTPEPLDAQVIGHLLWAAQGITSTDGGRTAPSAGALYPLELYIAKNDGVSHYRPEAHDLVMVRGRDVRADLRAAAFGQDPVAEAPLVIVIAADYARTAEKYGRERGARYVQLEAGHAAQNVLLEGDEADRRGGHRVQQRTELLVDVHGARRVRRVRGVQPDDRTQRHV